MSCRSLGNTCAAVAIEQERDQARVYIEGELQYRKHLEELGLDEGFVPAVDPNLDIGFNVDEGYAILRELAEGSKRSASDDSESAWRSLPEYTELYYDLYYSITLEEVMDINEWFSHLDDERFAEDGTEFSCSHADMCNMLLALEEELMDAEADEEERRLYPLSELEIWDMTDEWGYSLWRINYWRNLPGFQELYCDLYHTMSEKDVTILINAYRSVKCPDKIDPNILYMLCALEDDLCQSKANIWRSLPGFPELYCDLYDTLTVDTIRTLIDDYLDHDRPDDSERIDYNIVNMLEA